MNVFYGLQMMYPFLYLAGGSRRCWVCLND
jgi:hypothetical protein